MEQRAQIDSPTWFQFLDDNADFTIVACTMELPSCSLINSAF
jgi:hypothetical protein